MPCNQYLHSCCLLVTCLLVAYICPAQNTNTGVEKSIQQIENNIIRINNSGKDIGKPQTLLSRMQSLNVPGVSISVFDDGRIKWAKGYGVCDKNTSVPVDTATIFQAASISKPLTAAAMFALAEKKLINPDDDINQQLRSWKIPDNEYTTGEKVTPLRIVSHMGGLSIHGFKGYNHRDSIPDLLRILDGSAPANSKPVRVIYKPGSKQIYSGGGYTVLQLLLQEKTGKSFSELMDKLVLHPVAMNNSAFALTLPDNMMQHAAKGYLSNGDMINGGYNIYPEQAAAGLWTTPSDLSKFMLNVGNSYRDNNGILQQSTVQMMFKNVPPGNGSGFGIEGEGNTLRFSHLGSNTGYYCYAVSFINAGKGIVIMTNSGNGFQLIKEIVRAVYREYRWMK